MLGQLAPVPATFLKQLATDQELFDELPRSVQRQVTTVLSTCSRHVPLEQGVPINQCRSCCACSQ